MTQLEDLLRGALATAPTPATSTPDPLSDLERRIGRARRRLGSIAVAAVVAIVLAIVLPLALIGSGGDSARIPPAHEGNVPVQTWSAQAGPVLAATAGGGFVWSLELTGLGPGEAITSHTTSVVEQRDPATGAVLRTYPLTTPARGAAYGAGGLWVWGGGDKTHPDTTVSVVEPSPGVVSTADLRQVAAIEGFGFAANHAYAFDARHGVYSLNETGSGAQVTGRRFPGVVDVVGGHDTLFLLGDHRIVAQYPVADGWHPDLDVFYGITIDGLPLVESAKGFWTVQGRNLVQEDPQGHQLGATVTPPLFGNPTFSALSKPLAAVVDPAGGLYVAMSNDGGPRIESLLYYSPAALRSSAPQPTAVHVGSEQAETIALDPAGGVVWFAAGGFGRWNPAGG
jgi:hypothetical protein